MVKMSDVAKRANVSTATVSRVLSKEGYVSEETRNKVLEAIDILGYTPNRLASNFRKSSSHTVLAIIPDITNPFFSEVVKGLEKVAAERGYHVLLGDTGNSLHVERDLMELVREQVADGVILATARVTNEEIEKLGRGLPIVVACEYFDGISIPTVSIDNVVAAREATQYLIDCGHRRIAFISGRFNIVLNRDRIRGYRQALEYNGLHVHEGLIQEGDWTMESGMNAMSRILAMDQLPTAVFAASDEMAVGALKSLKAKGLRVPDDMSVMGFDDISLSEMVEPELSTVQQPKRELGELAIRMLLNIIEGKKLERTQVILSHRLVIRGSTAPPRSAHEGGR
ncbi:HTH-type transcriptional repressor CytR [Peptococcaceae bacterium CEB3]|nr:HTH-type transcriptional repressor CytR [Peptococcaceae bacterium CEB3]